MRAAKSVAGAAAQLLMVVHDEGRGRLRTTPTTEGACRVIMQNKVTRAITECMEGTI